jgi:hypothetical protein
MILPKILFIFTHQSCLVPGTYFKLSCLNHNAARLIIFWFWELFLLLCLLLGNCLEYFILIRYPRHQYQYVLYQDTTLGDPFTPLALIPPIQIPYLILFKFKGTDRPESGTNG